MCLCVLLSNLFILSRASAPLMELAGNLSRTFAFTRIKSSESMWARGSFHYICACFNDRGSLMPSRCSGIPRCSVGWLVQRLCTSTPLRVGKITSTKLISQSSSNIYRDSSPSPP
jgi:hypothetical protein